jgi:hypothetical protein
MWALDNQTPFAAERGWVRGRDGTEIWLVAVKCTFDVLDGGSTQPSAVQPPALQMAEYYGEPGQSSVRYESDLALAKTTTDILMVGEACAPNDVPVTQLDVGFRVGDLQKVLRVHGDRNWGPLGPTAPAPFLRMPLVYERAFGGVDRRSPEPDRDWEWRNPVGCGFAVAGDHAVGTPMPNIEWIDQPIRQWSDRPPPAGFGAIAAHWQPRVRFAGTYDEHWARTRQPLWAADLDVRYFQCAPEDQQAARFLRGGEPVVLLNVSPRGTLRFALPRVRLGFETFFYDGDSEIHRHRQLHTVILEPGFPRVSLVWQSALPCHFKVQKLARTVVTLKEDKTVTPDASDESSAGEPT